MGSCMTILLCKRALELSCELLTSKARKRPIARPRLLNSL
jgi:hypothetical protein